MSGVLPPLLLCLDGVCLLLQIFEHLKQEGTINELLCPVPLDIGKTVTCTVQTLGSVFFC